MAVTRQIAFELNGKLARQFGTTFRAAEQALSRYQQQLGQTERRQEAFNRSSRSMGRAMASNVGTVVRYMAGFAAAYEVKEFAANAVRNAATLEQETLAFEVMLKSQQQAMQLMMRIRKFAAKTPYESPELIESTKLLIAYGVQHTIVMRKIEMLGNIASGVKQPLNEVAMIYGKAKTQGRLYTRDIMEFAGRGIPVIDELARMMRVSTADVLKMTSEGKIGFAELDKALQHMTTGQGKFAGLIARQSLTLGGLYSTLKDNVNLTATDMVMKYLPNLKRAVNWAIRNMPKVQKAAERALNRIGDWFEENQPMLREAGATLKRAFEAAKPTLRWLFTTGLPKAIALLTVILKTATRVANWIMDHWPAIKPIVIGIISVLASAKLALEGLLLVNRVKTMIDIVRELKGALFGVAGAARTAAGSATGMWTAIAGPVGVGVAVGSAGYLAIDYAKSKAGAFAEMRKYYSDTAINRLALREYQKDWHALSLSQMQALQKKYAKGTPKGAINPNTGNVFNTPTGPTSMRPAPKKRIFGFANGAIVRRQTLAMIGEKNRREAVIPLENKARGIPLLQTAAQALGVTAGATVNVSIGNITLANGTPEQARAAGRTIAEEVRRALTDMQRKEVLLNYG